MEERNRANWKRYAYVMVLVLVCIPLTRGAVQNTGDIHIWLARIEEVKEGLLTGVFVWFPSAELTVSHSGQFSALNSNLWLLFPACLRLFGVPVYGSYAIYMLVLNVIALLVSKKFFTTLFSSEVVGLIGVVLYMTCPYRIYLCYDKAALGMVAAWSVLPLVMGSIMKFIEKTMTWKEWAINAVLLALIGYADGILMLIVMGILACGALRYRWWKGFLLILGGGIAFGPGLIYLGRYLLKGGMEVWNLPTQSIASKGYAVGQLFSTWIYSEDHPGMGLGLLAVLAVLGWLICTEKELLETGQLFNFFTGIMCLLVIMSLQIFPWDIIQRLGQPFLRLVGLIETPGIFLGVGCFMACVLGTYGISGIISQKHSLVKIGIPAIVGIASVSVMIYNFNMLAK